MNIDARSLEILVDVKETMGNNCLKELQTLPKGRLESIYLGVKLLYHVRQFYKATTVGACLAHAEYALGYFDALSRFVSDFEPEIDEIRERLDIGVIVNGSVSAMATTAQIEITEMLNCLVEDDIWFKGGCDDKTKEGKKEAI